MIFPDVSGYDCRRPDPNNPNTYIYDRPMDWAKQVANGARFAFIKCSEYAEDGGFKVQWNAAKKLGLILGAWHYFHPSVNAITQAQMQIGLLKQVGMNWTGDPKTSDKIQLDLETWDGVAPLLVARAVASWYNEVNVAFPNFEKDIYVGWYFWNELLSVMDMSWAKNTKWWLPAYPFDPTPRTINPPPPFDKERVEEISEGAFTTYAMKDLAPWGQPSYRQFTAYADSRFVPGHPGIKKVVDINVLNPKYFNEPVPTPIPQPATNPAYITNCAVNVRQENAGTSKWLGIIPVNTIVYIDKPTGPYFHFTPNTQFTSGGWIFSQYLTKK